MKDLEAMLDMARPSTVRQFWRAGAFHLRSAVGLVRSLPWLLGRGPSLGIVTRINAVAVGAKPAIHDRKGTVTWMDLERRSNQVANAMTGRGVRPGDRVGALLRNGREMAEVIVAAQKLGVEACPINTWARPEELRVIVEQTEPRLIVYDARNAEQLEPARPTDTTLLVVGDLRGLEGSEPYDTAVEDQPTSSPPPFTSQRGTPKILIHTSGTTGRPKGASRSAGGSGIREFAALLETVPLRHSDVLLCPAPLFHSFGILAFTLGSLLGSTLVLPDRFDPEESLDLIDRHRVTACAMVPVMLRRIVTLPERTLKAHDLSGVRVILVSGSALSQDLRERTAEVFGEVLYDLYGSTEAGWVAVAGPQDIRKRPGTVGRPVPGIEVAAFSENGQRLPTGETGELHARSGARFEGYIGGEETKEREGFLALGDLGRVDEEGYLQVEGRRDEMVVVGGENVYPIEVEEALSTVEGVDDVAVLGVEDEEYGQVLAAFYEGIADPEAVRKAAKDALASYKVPRRVDRVDSLPRTATGKVLKRELFAEKE